VSVAYSLASLIETFKAEVDTSILCRKACLLSTICCNEMALKRVLNTLSMRFDAPAVSS
jgi:hypothetical protein